MHQSKDEAEMLVARAQAGDKAAFATLYQRQYRRIYALCVRLAGDRHLAEELTQEAFISAWQNLHGFRREARFDTWLHKIAVNTVLGHRRRHASWLRRIVSMDEEYPDKPVHDSPGEARDLETAIAALPERARQVFVLVDVVGHSHDETAELLGIAVGTSKAQLSRARDRLRSMLS